jgi:hypothetical protein
MFLQECRQKAMCGFKLRSCGCNATRACVLYSDRIGSSGFILYLLFFFVLQRREGGGE